MKRKQSEEGFTLIEMMVVIVIIGILTTVVVLNVLPDVDKAAITRTRADIATLETALNQLQGRHDGVSEYEPRPCRAEGRAHRHGATGTLSPRRLCAAAAQ